ncbi:Imm26 family immunity protein [Flavivirga amylovorans]|uniref:Imm26 family immunity protein n=1 Tax=Flavivirga amylovorans TaxID=870486 RepID=A0ABT8WXA6_9FLAO|nr:Imm26 family immunity protein [Flavivirga amylovorans]MDO5986293.1 Imm26 family immunity protein [Flavivirga amylovorans]
MIKRKIIRIKLVGDYYTYGLIIDKTFMTFFDFITNDKNFDYKSVIYKPILFTNAVNYKKAMKTNEWEVMGLIEIEESLLDKRPYYIQDVIDNNKFRIALPPDYINVIPATKKDCTGLEIMGVYYPEHVLDRLNHHFFDTKLKWMSSLPFWLIDKLNDEKISEN